MLIFFYFFSLTNRSRMSDFDVKQALAKTRDEEIMEVGDHEILDDSKELAEQDVSNVDEARLLT